MPPSVLFLGRRVYFACVVVLVLAFHQQRPDSWCFRRLRSLLDVSPLTVKRWMDWFRDAFPSSEAWTRARGLFPASLRNDELPSSLFAVLTSEPPEVSEIAGCVSFVTTGASPPNLAS